VKEASELASDAINHPIETAGEFGKQAVKDVTSYLVGKASSDSFLAGLFLVGGILVIINLPVTKQWAADQA
jgi:hypothetical protein